MTCLGGVATSLSSSKRVGKNEDFQSVRSGAKPHHTTPHHTTPLLTTSLPRATMPRTGGSKKRKRASDSESPKKRQEPAAPRSQRKKKGQCRCGSTERKLITHGSCRLNKKNQSEVGGGCLPVCDLPIPSVVRSIACQSLGTPKSGRRLECKPRLAAYQRVFLLPSFLAYFAL